MRAGQAIRPSAGRHRVPPSRKLVWLASKPPDRCGSPSADGRDRPIPHPYPGSCGPAWHRGSVVEQWVWLLRFSPWKFTVGFEPSPVPAVGGCWSPSTRRKLFCPAHASSRVPSTVKCSSESKSRVPGLLQHGFKESVGNVAVQQTLTVLREHGCIPDRHHPCSVRRTSETAGCNPVAPSACARCVLCTAPATAVLAAVSRERSTGGPSSHTTAGSGVTVASRSDRSCCGFAAEDGLGVLAAPVKYSSTSMLAAGRFRACSLLPQPTCGKAVVL